MDLNLSLEQRMLKDSVDAFARDYVSTGRKASLAAPEGFSREAWRSIIALGWLGVALPEELGGYGGTPVDSMLIHEGIGAGLIVEPLLSTVLAARVIGLAGSAAQRENLLPPILCGDRLAVLAHYENAGRGDPLYIETTASPADSGWVLRGHKGVVIDAPSADHVVLSARLAPSNELALFAVAASRIRNRMMSCTTIDGLRAADIMLDGFQVSAGEQLTQAPDTTVALMEALDHATIANCAEALGAMDAALAVTAGYLDTRRQFGVAIGTFQALQHKLADMVIAVELARSILLHGVAGLQGNDTSARARAVSATKLRMIESARTIGMHAIQLHGGIGVTDEYVISHYFRKLDMLNRRFGGVDYHLDRFSAA